MGLKKYEIITVGSDKRVRALRSWQVGDRYVNIGDVGGIVYDEKTLSQDGACWLFRGNFGFPGARIGGDSIVDVAETALSTTGTPNVDVLGSSVVVGSKLQFEADQTTADAVVLTADDFEQGLLNFVSGANWETWKAVSNDFVRTKSPIFIGGAATTLKIDVPGFEVRAYVLDRDGIGATPAITKVSGAGVTLNLPAGYQYFVLTLVKNPFAPTVPADATTAAITFTGTYETKLSVIDSRVEINPANATGTVTIKPGGIYAISPGAKYPEAVIRNSKVSINVPASTNRIFRLMGRVIGSTATLDATAAPVVIAGIYGNVKNLMASGVLDSSTGVNAYNLIQATDCDNFAVSPTIFPGLAAARTANMPFIFQGCNVPNGLFYHHAQIANTYKNIDFALAQADLGKSDVNGFIMVSSEINGMYRVYSVSGAVFGALVESYDSVKSATLSNTVNSYGTTIYKDAYIYGLFDIAGTNVFGHKVRSHPLAQVLNVQPRAVQGGFSFTAGSSPVPSVDATRVRTERYFRINGANGIGVQNIPTGVEGRLVYLDGSGKYTGLGDWYTGSVVVPTISLVSTYAYILFRKTGDTAITPADLAGVTITVYNGCKIVNTGETAVSMKGNIRVEDNATLVNASVTGSGYFGGNAVMSGMDVNGYAYMKDNTLCTKTSENVQTFTSLIMEGNAVYNSIASLALTNLKLSMYDNSKVLGEFRNASVSVTMRDNATITAAGNLSGASTGTVTVQNDAVINTSITVVGDVTLRGSYVSTSGKTWTGKRVIDKHNAPEYDNNVKTQYDF